MRISEMVAGKIYANDCGGCFLVLRKTPNKERLNSWIIQFSGKLGNHWNETHPGDDDYLVLVEDYFSGHRPINKIASPFAGDI